MRKVRRNNLTARLEMTPLIDVIFLLLTFFIYSMILMVHANVLPVQLASVNTGKAANGKQSINAITIDDSGKLYWNQKPISQNKLSIRLKKMADKKQKPKLFLALQKTSDINNHNLDIKNNSAKIDRGPVLMHVVEQIRKAGIKDFVFVGKPGKSR